MNEAESPPITPLGSSSRYLCLASAIGLGTLLFVASRLTPSANGIGTHQQLGLPECTWIQLFKVRCLGCGMTTAWAHAASGNFQEAANANPAGLLLFAQAVFSVPVLLWLAYSNRPTEGKWFSRLSLWLLLITVGLAVMHWGFTYKLG